MVHMKCKSSLIWLILFLESASAGSILNIPFAPAQHSYDGLISHFLGRLGWHWALGSVRPFHVGHKQAHFLIGPPPLWVQLTVIPKWHQCPEDVDSEEGDGEGNKANSFESALQLQVVLCAPQTQPAGDSCQRCDEKEASHVTEESALLAARARVLQPLSEWLWSPFDSELCVTQFTVAGVGGWQPLLQAAFVYFTQSTSAVAGREQRLPSSSLVTNPTHTYITLWAHRFDYGGEWAAIFSRNLGDVLSLRGGVSLLWILGGIRFGGARIITKGAR